MDYKKYLFGVLALISMNDAIKVDMQGTVNIGGEVAKTISDYMRNFYSDNPSIQRRSKSNYEETDKLTFLIIQSTYLCRDISFCDGLLESFLNEYILIQTKSIESILKGILYPNIEKNENIENNLMFEEELKQCLQDIRSMLKEIDLRAGDNHHSLIWAEVLKRISIMLQTVAIESANDQIENTSIDVTEAKKDLTQKFVVASVVVERKYETKLCAEYDICTKTYKCTKGLDSLLEKFNDMPDENVKSFIRYVSEAISQTNFYSTLSDVTANELQIIFNDMAYSDSIPTKKILASIHKTVQERLKSVMLKDYYLKGKDVELVNAILSDMDHAYSKQSVDPFYTFMTHFYKWMRSDIRLGPYIRTLILDLSNQVNELSNDLILKLTNEVRVFLEITVDPEK